MPVANFLGPFAAVPAAAGNQLQAPTVLPFTMQSQEQSLWCWAAVAASVCQFLNDVGDNTQQCKIATAFIHSQCCINPMPPYGSSWSGNHEYPLSVCLSDLGHLANTAGKIGLDAIKSEIDLSRPVCLYVRYASGPVQGHFIAAIGYDQGRGEVTIRDPDARSPHNGNYVIDQIERMLGGTWDESYYVK